MYVLVVLQDKLKIQPEQFDRDTADVLIEQIEIKYSNKVILDVGLCVCFYDFLEVQESYVYPGEGSCHQVVKFRMVIFRPFITETLTGKILRSDADGIYISMGFFQDITVPASRIRQPASFNPDTKCWTWHYIHDDGSDDFPLAAGDEIRFKVQDCIFTTVTASMKERRVTMSTTAVNIMAMPNATEGVGGGVDEFGMRSKRGFFGVDSLQNSRAGGSGGLSSINGGGGGINFMPGGGGPDNNNNNPDTSLLAVSVRRQRSSSNIGIPISGVGLGTGSTMKQGQGQGQGQDDMWGLPSTLGGTNVGAYVEEPPMQIVGDISSEDGLGLVDWW